MSNKTFFFMKSIFVLFLMSGYIVAQVPHELPEDRSPQNNEVPVCIDSIDSICGTQYVEEVLELCKDCDIPAPEVTPPSGLQVWFTKWGIALFYTLHDAKDWISQKIFGDRKKTIPLSSID